MNRPPSYDCNARMLPHTTAQASALSGSPGVCKDCQLANICRILYSLFHYYCSQLFGGPLQNYGLLVHRVECSLRLELKPTLLWRAATHSDIPHVESICMLP